MKLWGDSMKGSDQLWFAQLSGALSPAPAPRSGRATTPARTRLLTAGLPGVLLFLTWSLLTAALLVLLVARPAGAAPSDNYPTGTGSNGIVYVGGVPQPGGTPNVDYWTLSADLYSGYSVDSCGDGCDALTRTWDRTTNTTVPAPASPSPTVTATPTVTPTVSPSPTASASVTSPPTGAGGGVSTEQGDALVMGTGLVVLFLSAYVVASWGHRG